MTKLSVAQQNMLDYLYRFPNADFCLDNPTLLALEKKGVIVRDSYRTAPSGIRFWTYRKGNVCGPKELVRIENQQ